MSAWRHVRAILLLPVVATLVVPALIVWWTGDLSVGWGLPAGIAWLPVVVGLALLGLGLALVLWTVKLFVVVGRGTIAPWDATSRLVVLGPYRRVRNPMISGVACVLAGESALLGSPPLLLWLGLFVAVNAVYMPLAEEPGLRRRFGEEYEAYCASVPRWVPRRARTWPPR